MSESKLIKFMALIVIGPLVINVVDFAIGFSPVKVPMVIELVHDVLWALEGALLWSVVKDD